MGSFWFSIREEGFSDSEKLGFYQNGNFHVGFGSFKDVCFNFHVDMCGPELLILKFHCAKPLYSWAFRVFTLQMYAYILV